MNRITSMALLAMAAPTLAHAMTFTTGDLVVSVEGNGVYGVSSGPYTDNQAAPLAVRVHHHGRLPASATAAAPAR